jgi:hypothetical protein
MSRFAPREGSSQLRVQCCNLRHSIGSVSIVAAYGHSRRFEETQFQWTLTFEITPSEYRSILHKLEQGITGIGDPPDEKKMWRFGQTLTPFALSFQGKRPEVGGPEWRKAGKNMNQNRQSSAVVPLVFELRT